MSLLLITLAGCSGSRTKSSNSNIEFASEQKQYEFSFLSNDDSAVVKLKRESAEKFHDFVSSISLAYPYEDIYGVSECYDRIFTDSHIQEHKFSALNNDGELTAEHLKELILENNKQFLDESKNVKGFYKEPDGEFLLSICQLIVDTVSEIQNRYPDIDYDRVYCNMANLKVFYKVGLLSFAEVTTDMILQLGDAMLQFANIMTGGTGTRDVLIHEIMHMVQLGCACEDIDHCVRRAGITYRWDDVELQGNDWAWLFEGSAELNMCMLTGDNPMTYQTMINYIQSLNLAAFLDNSIPANYAQTISFFNDPNKLFDAFHATTKEEIIEIANLMEAIQIIQFMPEEFTKSYEVQYGEDASQTNVADRIRYTLKPAICLTLSKSFYRNLTYAILDNDNVTEKDVLYLIRIFEAAMDYHTTYSNPERKEVNEPFIDNYKVIRKAFFDMMKQNNALIDENTYYSFKAFSDNEKIVNASFMWLGQEKRIFLIERTEFLSDLSLSIIV